MREKEKKRTWIPGELNTVRQLRETEQNLSFDTFTCLQSCCHILQLCSVDWQRLSFFHCALLTLPMVGSCVFGSVCVLNLHVLITLADPCSSRMCVKCMCLSVCHIHAGVCLCARQMFPGRCHCSVFTHTALRKINQHFIYLFALLPILLNPW